MNVQSSENADITQLCLLHTCISQFIFLNRRLRSACFRQCAYDYGFHDVSTDILYKQVDWYHHHHHSRRHRRPAIITIYLAGTGWSALPNLPSWLIWGNIYFSYYFLRCGKKSWTGKCFEESVDWLEGGMHLFVIQNVRQVLKKHQIRLLKIHEIIFTRLVRKMLNIDMKL